MSATEEATRIARLAAKAADDKKGKQIVAFDVSEPLAIADIFLIVSANNERLVGAIVDAIEEKLIDVAKLRPLRREGGRENRWVLLDYGDLVVHVQHDEERDLYALERLWKDCPIIELGLPDDDSEPAGDGDEQ
ncbi:ribosome silencing factor [Brooklawnia sp.]|uniref:ribosome silencing factor n=1 Tax=Brooklawnia sp. TaxID=2699740 RepID=UPI00311E6E90